MDLMMFFELGCSGHWSTTRFQGLSGGNTSRVDRTASASGVCNWIGLSTRGILAARMRATRAGSPLTWTALGAGKPPTTKGVTVKSMSRAPTLPLIL
jgi:hypothetical protein